MIYFSYSLLSSSLVGEGGLEANSKNTRISKFFASSGICYKVGLWSSNWLLLKIYVYKSIKRETKKNIPITTLYL